MVLLANQLPNCCCLLVYWCCLLAGLLPLWLASLLQLCLYYDRCHHRPCQYAGHGRCREMLTDVLWETLTSLYGVILIINMEKQGNCSKPLSVILSREFFTLDWLACCISTGSLWCYKKSFHFVSFCCGTASVKEAIISISASLLAITHICMQQKAQCCHNS